eukprot:TRINITY_DN4398_c0_g1_i1.p1 TRINITY_DN4398_c0_g1~~TRINITY_DN4398_c0_g1_i1.p1  ORF type:complete len:411 (-),score=110.05 TRINITY_DN4398_c0_g1_i1:100-1269(-)
MELADLNEKSNKELIDIIAQLQADVKEVPDLKAKVLELEQQVQHHKTTKVELQNLAEAEEEYITNTLLKKLEKLQAEKNQILLQLELEEEYLTNTLHKRVSALQAEKVELERALEEEEEFIVHKLQRQLSALEEERSELQKKVEELCPGELQVSSARSKIHDLEAEKEELKEKISELEHANFIANQQIADLKEQLRIGIEQKTEMEREVEFSSEHHFNTLSAKSNFTSSSSTSASPEITAKSGHTTPSPTLSIATPARRLSASANIKKLSVSPKSPGIMGYKVLLSGWMVMSEVPTPENSLSSSQDSFSNPTKYFFSLSDDGLLKGFESQTILEEPIVEFNLDLGKKVRQSHFDITLVVANETYQFSCPDERSAKEWTSVISELLPGYP